MIQKEWVSFKGGSQRFLVDFSGQMNRAAATDRVPPGGVRNAKILDFQADSHEGFIHRQFNDPGSRFPGCPARCSPDNLYMTYGAVAYFDGKNRFAEFFTVLAQTVLPGKGASGRRCMDSDRFEFLAGGNQGDTMFSA